MCSLFCVVCGLVCCVVCGLVWLFGVFRLFVVVCVGCGCFVVIMFDVCMCVVCLYVRVFICVGVLCGVVLCCGLFGLSCGDCAWGCFAFAVICYDSFVRLCV